MQKIILASTSPRRKQLLEWANIPFEVITKPTKEKYPPTLPVQAVATHLAQKKAKAVATKHPDCIVLAADTIVVNQLCAGGCRQDSRRRKRRSELPRTRYVHRTNTRQIHSGE